MLHQVFHKRWQAIKPSFPCRSLRQKLEYFYLVPVENVTQLLAQYLFLYPVLWGINRVKFSLWEMHQDLFEFETKLGNMWVSPLKEREFATCCRRKYLSLSCQNSITYRTLSIDLTYSVKNIVNELVKLWIKRNFFIRTSIRGNRVW